MIYPITEDNFEVINFYHENDGRIKISEQLKNQILADYEKARKYEKYFEELTDKILKSIKITFKLRELIEKRIEENEPYKNDPDSGGLYHELKQLLEDSKK